MKWSFLAIAAVIIWYAGSCWLWPYAHCRICAGTGRHERSDGKVHRPCWWCRGSGRRLRIGRRIYNRYARARRDS